MGIYSDLEISVDLTNEQSLAWEMLTDTFSNLFGILIKQACEKEVK
jgi:hypothetical protein